MEYPNRRTLASIGAAVVLAAAGITGVVTHNPVHAASQPTASVQAPEKNTAEGTDQQDPAGANQQDTTGVDMPGAAGTEQADAADSNSTDIAEKTDTDTDPNAPCAGTGDTQTGNCTSGSGPDTAGGN